MREGEGQLQEAWNLYMCGIERLLEIKDCYADVRWKNLIGELPME
jgi:hypothetical protein